jgi:thiamine-monophosphate kinase
MDRESALISQLTRLFPSPVNGLGIGDDCAVIPLDDQTGWLLSTDTLVDNTHFLHKLITPEQLAYKTVMVNVSDIAAMGGTPKYVLLNLGLNQAFHGKWADRFLTSLAKVLAELNIHLIGGDTVLAKQQLFVNLTIIGTAPLAHIKYRKNAQVGDLIVVSKALGGSYAGLQLLLNHWQGSKPTSGDCLQQHLAPQAQLHQGQWLSRHSDVHAMMDISDGLAADLAKLCRASQLGANLNLDHLPIDPAAHTLALLNQVRPIDVAYAGGEDYGLLMTIAPEAFVSLAAAYQRQFNQRLTAIGIITSEAEKLILNYQQQAFWPQLSTFNHFD